MDLAVVGASGFMGRAIAREIERRGHHVRRIRAPRILWDQEAQPTTVDVPFDLVNSLRGCCAVINAAGLASPTSRRSLALTGANAALPVVLALAAAQADVSRFVHISSGAVKGRLPLDESPDTSPLTPYAESKALGERWLSSVEAELDKVIYRATSVRGTGQVSDHALRLVGRIGIAPILTGPDRMIPTATDFDTAGGIVAAALAPAHDPNTTIQLHPWSGDTVRSTLRSAGVRHFIPIPAGPVSSAFGCLYWLLAARFPLLVATSRRIELITLGQRMHDPVLRVAGPDAL